MGDRRRLPLRRRGMLFPATHTAMMAIILRKRRHRNNNAAEGRPLLLPRQLPLPTAAARTVVETQRGRTISRLKGAAVIITEATTTVRCPMRRRNNTRSIRSSFTMIGSDILHNDRCSRRRINTICSSSNNNSSSSRDSPRLIVSST